MVLDLPAIRIARPIITIDASATVVEASKNMAESNRGSVVVTSGGKTVGLLTERDILRRVVARNRDPSTTRVRGVMTKSPITIGKDRPLREAIDLLNRKGVRRMLLTDKGKIVGIFTIRDVVKHIRICVYCGKDIMSFLESAKPEAYVECECGSMYHKACAETVVHCVSCSKTLVANIVYPERSETFAG